jgi:hypothetical protein
VVVTPPLACRVVVRLLLPGREREVIAGDLYEEYFFVLPRRGRRAATRWLIGQVLRAVLPLARVRIQRLVPTRGAALAATLGAYACGLLPLWLGEWTRTYVLAHVPLRAAHEASNGYWVVESLLGVGLALVGAWLGALLFRRVKGEGR